ncbi:MAG: hypothetical protein ACYCS7_11095 [Acidimicrobiales bacterium]
MTRSTINTTGRRRSALRVLRRSSSLSLSSLAAAGLMAGGIVGVTAVVEAGPVSAGPCSPDLAISPVVESPPTASPVISGTASTTCGSSYHLVGPIQISILSSSDPGPSAVPKGDASFTAPVSDKGTWAATVPAPLTYNGAYQVTATVNSTGVAGPQSTTQGANFTVAVPPARPTGLIVTPIAGGGFHLSWTPNTEPDLVGYVVLRSGGGEPVSRAISCTPGHGSCPTSYSDNAASASTVYSYQIGADRYGVTQAPADEVYSGPSAAVSTASATPPVGGDSPAAGGGGGGSGSTPSGSSGFTGPPRYVIPGPGFAFDPNTNILSGLGGISSQADPSAAAPGASETGAPTSGGFNPYLPYSESPPATPSGLSAEAALASDQGHVAKVHQMSSIALALILVAVAGELLGLRRRMLETLPIRVVQARRRVIRRRQG